MPVLGKVGLVNKGTYNASTAYTALDFVQYDGSSYVALKSVQGVTPSNDGTNWQYLARGTALALQDNLLTTTPGQYALDARQGSVIKSSLDSLNDSLANCATKTELANSTFQHVTVPSDLNSMTTLWQYTDFTFAKTPSNAPYGAGTVYTLGGMSHMQVMFPYDITQGTKFVFLRTRYSNTWGAWYKVAVAAV